MPEKNLGEYETSGVSPPCSKPPITPITQPSPVLASTLARNGPPLVPLVKLSQSNTISRGPKPAAGAAHLIGSFV